MDYKELSNAAFTIDNLIEQSSNEEAIINGGIDIFKQHFKDTKHGI